MLDFVIPMMLFVLALVAVAVLARQVKRLESRLQETEARHRREVSPLVTHGGLLEARLVVVEAATSELDRYVWKLANRVADEDAPESQRKTSVCPPPPEMLLAGD